MTETGLSFEVRSTIFDFRSDSPDYVERHSHWIASCEVKALQINERSTMDLNKAECRRLIAIYKEQNCLWDRNDNKYFSKEARKDAWRHISREMSIPVGDLKKKMISLMGGYRREKSRENQKSRVAGSVGAVYKSKWFAFKDFAFMTEKNIRGTASILMEEDKKKAESAENDDGDVGVVPTIGRSTKRFKQSTRTITTPKQPTPTPSTETNNRSLCDSQFILNNKTDRTKDGRVLENEFDIYGLYVASQLKLLSEEQSVMARGEIQTILTRCRLANLRKKSENIDLVLYREENNEETSERFTLNQFNDNDSDSETDHLLEYSEIKTEVNDSHGGDASMEDTDSN